MLNELANKEIEKMPRTNNEEDLINQLYVLMQPTRLKIVKLLKETKEPLYIEQIAERIKEDRRSVSFHLAALAESGFVEGEYKIIQPATENPSIGRGGKFYKLTPNVDAVLQKLDSILK